MHRIAKRRETRSSRAGAPHGKLRIKWVWVAVALLAAAVAGDFVAPGRTRAGSVLTGKDLIQFLNQTINWYRQLAVEQRTASSPDEQIIVEDNRQIAVQTVQLAFDFARAQADTLTKQTGANQSAGGGAASGQYQGLAQMEAKLAKDYQDTQAELEGDQRKAAAATGQRKRQLESEVSELEGELALAGARRDTLENMLEFVNGTSANGVGANGLRAQIEALASSVPAVTLNSTSGKQNRAESASQEAASNAAMTGGAEVSGIWGFASDIFDLSGKIQSINAIIAQTAALSKASKDLRTPFITQLKDLSAKGDQLAAQADAANSAVLAQEKQQLDALTEQFKGISSAVIPLSKQAVLLNLYQRNLTDWRDTLSAREGADWKALGARLGLLFLVLVAVVVAAEIWRRIVFRYVHEPRRRHQLLLLRKFVLWLVIGLIIAFTLAGRLSSFVTFAGLLTAGVAVALQNVILSVVGYFFLIGKFGVRVGDRVQIGGVTGEVIDIGLVRLHLMEVGGGGFDAPTGRVVAFSNSIVFQSGAGLFKQIPGTSFVWHEVTLLVPHGVDFGLIKEKLLGAVKGVLADYRAEMERQYREMERSMISVPADKLEPKVLLRVTATAIEAVIRFPVDLRHSAEIDERVSHAVIKAVEGESKLKMPGSEIPEVKLLTNIPASDAAS